MCGGLEFRQRNNETTRVLFPNPKAALLVDPAMNTWLPWGRRKEQPGDWPDGGWARFESLHKGYWKRWGSERTLLWPVRWMEKDRQRKSQWFDLPPGHALVCLTLTKAPGTPIYVVTSPAEGDYLSDIHDRIPKLVPVAAALEAHRLAGVGGEFDGLAPMEALPDGDPTFGIELGKALLALDIEETFDWAEADVRKWFREEFAPRFPELIQPWSEDAAASLAFSEMLVGKQRVYGNAPSGPRQEPRTLPEKKSPVPRKEKPKGTPLPLGD